MAAGLNIAVAIWRYLTPSDDAGGGALTSGTYSYPYLCARLEEEKMSTLLLQQGIEVQEVWYCFIQPGDLQINERDELEVVAPYNHPYFHQRFRIIDVENSSLNLDDSRCYTRFTLTRRSFAHANQ